ncbi:MAG TPA: PDZ domain-containing protein [Pirellulales bacterium]|nr:PDZ domain-containing protein [Pirellulales bacterium]
MPPAASGAPPAPENAANETAEAKDLAASILGAKIELSDGKVIVSHVKRAGTADRAGVRPGDQITSIEKHPVSSPEDVVKVLSHFKPGDGVVLTVIPKPGPRQIFVAPPLEQAAPAQPGMLGVTLNESAGAVTAGEVSMGGPAVVAGLRSGDQIVAVDGQPVTSKAQILAAVNKHRAGNRISLAIKRGGGQRSVMVRLGARSQVAALPKLWVPSPQTPQQEPASPGSQGVEDPNDEWADPKEAEDLYNVNERALYTDFD